jgi:hypothetical protein
MDKYLEEIRYDQARPAPKDHDGKVLYKQVGYLLELLESRRTQAIDEAAEVINNLGGRLEAELDAALARVARLEEALRVVCLVSMDDVLVRHAKTALATAVTEEEPK